MSVAIEFIDFIVPIKIIRGKYPGGWDACLKDHAELIGGRVWYDNHLFRDGAMSPNDMQIIVKRWESMGFDLYEEQDGKRCWKDVCVVEWMFGGATLRCEWIDFVPKSIPAVFLKGTDPGEIIGREYFINECKV